MITTQIFTGRLRTTVRERMPKLKVVSRENLRRCAEAAGFTFIANSDQIILSRTVQQRRISFSIDEAQVLIPHYHAQVEPDGTIIFSPQIIHTGLEGSEVDLQTSVRFLLFSLGFNSQKFPTGEAVIEELSEIGPVLRFSSEAKSRR